MSLDSRMRLCSGGLALVLGLLGQSVSAQQDSVHVDMEGMREQMGAQMDMMAPMMGQMPEASITATLAVLSKPEAATRLAAFTRNYDAALLKTGFTKDEALRIVTSVGIPLFRDGQ